eukprot:gene19840-20333_t
MVVLTGFASTLFNGLLFLLVLSIVVSGLQVGDRILEIDGSRVTSFMDILPLVVTRAGEHLKITVQRSDKVLDFDVVPRFEQKETDLGIERSGRLGIKPDRSPQNAYHVDLNVGQAFLWSLETNRMIVTQTLSFFGRLLTGREYIDQISGVARMANAVAESASFGFADLARIGRVGRMKTESGALESCPNGNGRDETTSRQARVTLRGGQKPVQLPNRFRDSEVAAPIGVFQMASTQRWGSGSMRAFTTEATRVAVVATLLTLTPVVGMDFGLLPVGQARAEVVSSIIVRGNQRMDPETVKSYLTIKPGKSFTAKDIDDSLKALYATELFGD